jgi:hypothetical protein
MMLTRGSCLGKRLRLSEPVFVSISERYLPGFQYLLRPLASFPTNLRENNMPEHIMYYAVIGTGRTVTDPSGLVRRRRTIEGAVDETFTRELSWKFTDAIYQDERGENFGPELVEISAGEAEALIERFRRKWGHQP